MILASGSPVLLALSVGAALCYALPAAAARFLSAPLARGTLVVAWVAHAAALGAALLGDQPHFGFATALSITVWLMLLVYAIELQLLPRLPVRWALAGLGSAAVVLATVFPGTPMHATASAWLPLHLALGVACYGLFGAAVVHAWYMTRAEKRFRQAADPDSGVPLLTLERLTFRFVASGFVLLTATLLAGWLFGELLYGTQGGWRWDHKTVFSVLSWLAFATLLIGRARFGWRGRRAVGMLYLGTALLLLAYVGSRFVSEVILGRLA